MAALAVACRAAASSLAQRGQGVLPRALHHLLPHQQQSCQYSDAPDIIPLQRKQQQQQQPATTTAGQQQELAVSLPEQNIGPWERVIDKASGQPYYFNPKTGVTTPTGAPQPDAWVAVRDQQTQVQYFWNKQSGETTAVGEPLPGPEGRVVVAGRQQQQQQQQQQAGGVGSMLTQSLAMGFGVGLVFALIRLVF